MARNPTWSRDELILALDLYLRHRERLPDSDDAEIVELSQTLNSLFGEQAKDAALFRNRNGVYMKLANFRAVDPLHTSQGKRGLSRGGNGVAELWEEFSNRTDELKLIASAIRAAAAAGISPQPDDDDEIAEALEGGLLTRMHLTRERNRVLIRKKREAVLRETGRLACEVCSFDFSTTYGTHGTGLHRSPSRLTASYAQAWITNPATRPRGSLRQLPSNDSFQTQLADSIGIEGNASAPP